MARFLFAVNASTPYYVLRGMTSRQRHIFIFLGITTLIALTSNPHTTYARDFVRMSAWDDAVFDSLEDPTPDPQACFQVREGAEWVTDAGTYRFESGTLTFLRTVAGRPTGCHCL
jgi:hypothetical protein